MRSIKWWGDHAHYHAMGQNGVLASMNGIRTSSIAHVMPKSLLKHHQGGQWAQNVAPNRQEQPFGEGGAPLTKMAIMDANAWWLMWHQISTKCAILTSETKKKHSYVVLTFFLQCLGIRSHIRLPQTSGTELKAQNWGENSAVWRVAPSQDTVRSKQTLESECTDILMQLAGVSWHSENILGNAYVTTVEHGQKMHDPCMWPC